MKNIQSYVKRTERCLKNVSRTLNASRCQKIFVNVLKRKSIRNAFHIESIYSDASDLWLTVQKTLERTLDTEFNNEISFCSSLFILNCVLSRKNPIPRTSGLQSKHQTYRLCKWWLGRGQDTSIEWRLRQLLWKIRKTTYWSQMHRCGRY